MTIDIWLFVMLGFNEELDSMVSVPHFMHDVHDNVLSFKIVRLICCALFSSSFYQRHLGHNCWGLDSQVSNPFGFSTTWEIEQKMDISYYGVFIWVWQKASNFDCFSSAWNRYATIFQNILFLYTFKKTHLKKTNCMWTNGVTAKPYYIIQFRECLASWTLSLKLFMLRMKWILFHIVWVPRQGPEYPYCLARQTDNFILNVDI